MTVVTVMTVLSLFWPQLSFFFLLRLGKEETVMTVTTVIPCSIRMGYMG